MERAMSDAHYRTLKKLADAVSWPDSVESCHEELKEQYAFIRQTSIDLGRTQSQLKRAEWCLFQANRLYREILGDEIDLDDLSEHDYIKATIEALRKIREMKE